MLIKHGFNELHRNRTSGLFDVLLFACSTVSSSVFHHAIRYRQYQVLCLCKLIDLLVFNGAHVYWSNCAKWGTETGSGGYKDGQRETMHKLT